MSAAETNDRTTREAVACSILNEETDAGAILLFRELHLAVERNTTGSVRVAAEAETTALLALCMRLNSEGTLNALAQIEEWSGD